MPAGAAAAGVAGAVAREAPFQHPGHLWHPGEPSTDVEPAEPGELDGPSSVSPDEDSSSDQ